MRDAVRADIGVIGGSGLYELAGSQETEEIDIPTPFGMPSDLITIVKSGRARIAFLPRHGRGHRLLPTEVPSAANIWALKSLGVKQILSVSAVGSLQPDIRPGEFVVCDQLIDRTRSRPNSYFGQGIVGHVGFADPFCASLRHALCKALGEDGHPSHDRGTLICMEGPAFSTRAESNLYRSWGAHCIGMTALPEAKLAREAEICYALIAMVTDFDCWHETEESVTLDMVLQTMAANTQAVGRLIPRFATAALGIEDCDCRHAAANVVVTAKEKIPYELRRKLALFYGHYWA